MEGIAAMTSRRHYAHVSICPRRFNFRRSTLVACSAPVKPTPTEADLSPNGIFRLALLSGAVAGFTVDAVLFPLDTLKTRLQVATTAAKGAPALLTGLYAGFGPAVVASAPAAAAFFGVYDYVKRRLADAYPKRAESPLFHVMAAAAGDISSSTVRVPFEVVKQRLQSGMHATTAAAVSNILKTEGPSGFFAGYSSLIVRELPFDALQFPLYEYFKVELARRRGRPLHTWETSVCGSLAGGLAATVTTPLDVVKTRLMTQSAIAPKYHGLVHGLRTIAREEGLPTLMSGVAPRVLWISLGGAIFFGAYEAAKKKLTPYVAKSDKKNKA